MRKDYKYLNKNHEGSIYAWLPENAVNKWKNEIWLAKHKREVVYNKPKTWENCWVKYGLVFPYDVSVKFSEASNKSLMINWGNPKYREFRFPTITDIKDFIEKGGNVGYAIKQAVNRDELANEVYKVHSSVDWSLCEWNGSYRPLTFLGNQWYTHAWDSKGADLGYTGWGKPWTFNFTKNANTSKYEYGLSLPYMFAGSNLLNITFNFSEGVRINNAQGMFKALQCPLQLRVNVTNTTKQDNAEEGFSPFVLSSCFQQTGEQIKKTPDCINYHNCHTFSTFVHDTWGLHTISAYKSNGQIGENRIGNVIQPNKPSEGTYPNYNRNNWRMFGRAYGLTTIEPLVDLIWNTDNTIFEGSPNVTEVRIKNLNGSDFNFEHLTKMSEASVKYMLDNLYDRTANYRDTVGMTPQEKKQWLDQHPVVHTNPFTIRMPEQWRGFVTPEHANIARARNWKLVIGGTPYEG